MTRSILSLPPELREVWSRVYAIAWGHNAYQDTEGNPRHAHDKAEEAAWEAVRRANGGVLPEEPKADPAADHDDPEGELYLAIETVLFAFANEHAEGKLTPEQREAIDDLEAARSAVFGGSTGPESGS